MNTFENKFENLLTLVLIPNSNGFGAPKFYGSQNFQKQYMQNCA